MKKIEVDDIDKFAFIPQCTDNQFIPNKLLNSFNPSSDEHRIIRYDETRKELVRSMIYSSQILVNRVAFFNNDVFLDFYNNDEDKRSLVTLFNTGRVIPVLHNEGEFTREEIENKNIFTLNNKIKSFFNFLDEELRDSDLLYLVSSGNQDVMSRMTSYFSSFFGWIGATDIEETKELVKELSPNRINDEKYVGEFHTHLWRIADEYVKLNRESQQKDKPFGREQYYEYWVVKKDTKPVDMYIDKEKKFAIETKKIIDLAYCYNLAASYDRYFFAPEGMPTPLVLGGALRASSHKLRNSGEYKQAAKREELIYKVQKKYSIPDASNLSLSQVVIIQSTKEWQSFIKFQREVFNNPSTWNAALIKEYATVLGSLYSRIETDYKEFPVYENVYFGIKIVVKFTKYISEYIEMTEISKIVDAIDQMLDKMSLFQDQTIHGIIKVKHFIFNNEDKIIEEFATGLSEIELEESDLQELKRNYSSVDLSMKSVKESTVQR